MRLLERLIAMGVGVTQARLFEEPLMAAMALHAINSPVQQAGFLAQAVFESDSFTDLEENLWYTTPARLCLIFPSRIETLEMAAKLVRNPKALANRVYSNRGGNGDEASGDGWKYHGRGIFQLTFRDNYIHAGLGCGIRGEEYAEKPELLVTPTHACLSAAFYWWDHGCNTLMESRLFDQTTREINGPAMLHAVERRTLYRKILEVMNA